MTKIMRVFKDFSENDKVELAKIGIKIDVGFDAFEIPEHEYEKVLFIKKCLKDASYQKRVNFSNDDLDNSDYLDMDARRLLGYPEPDSCERDEVDSFEYPFDIYPYYKDVFSVIDTDPDYGMLKGEQIGSYQLKGEPKWGKAVIGSYHFIYDTFFVTPNIYNLIFKPLGIECRPVINYRTKGILQNVLQLVSQGVAKSKLNLTEDYVDEVIVIKKWNLEKYMLKPDETRPNFLSEPGDYDFFSTQEYFGAGGITQRLSIISNRLYKILKKNKIKNLLFTPLK